MKFIILSVFISSGALAVDTFKIGGELVSFKNNDGLLVKGCETNCQALAAVTKFKKIDLKKLRGKEQYNGSIGSDVCRLAYKGNSVIGINEDKDQRAFCVFKDNSLIEINSLGQYLTEKKIVTP
jgi:hypothetical protein